MIPLEEKVFELMEKMYSGMQNGFKELRGDTNQLKEELKNDIKSVKTGQIRFENDLKPKVEAALDGYRLVYEKLEVLENKVDKLAATVESHDVKIEVIRGVK